MSRNSWFCRSGCSASPVSAVARSTAGPPPAPADIFCKYFYKQMTPSRPTSLAGGDLHVGEDGLEVRQLDGGGPRAGASTPGRRGGHGHRGRGAGVKKNIITLGVTVNLSVCCLTCCWWCSGCCQLAVWTWCCQFLQTTSNVRIVYCFGVFSTGLVLSLSPVGCYLQPGETCPRCLPPAAS